MSLAKNQIEIYFVQKEAKFNIKAIMLVFL